MFRLNGQSPSFMEQKQISIFQRGGFCLWCDGVDVAVVTGNGCVESD